MRPSIATDAANPISVAVDSILGAADELDPVEAHRMVTWLDGLVTAAAIGPDRIRPDELVRALPISHDSSPAPAAVNALMMLVGMRNNQILSQIVNQRYDYTPDFMQTDEPAEQMGLAMEWADGFRRGVGLRPGSWRPILDDDYTASALLPIVALMGRERKQPADAGMSPEAMRADREAAIPEIGMAVYECYEFWRRQTGRKSMALAPSDAKIGRNALCPCGSGKKFKKCCIE